MFKALGRGARSLKTSFIRPSLRVGHPRETEVREKEKAARFPSSGFLAIVLTALSRVSLD
jgi:hypothetical protein